MTRNFDQLSFPNYPDLNSPMDPQLIGLIHQVDRDRAMTDPATIMAFSQTEGDTPLFVPVRNNSEANQVFFGDGSNSFYFNYPALDKDIDPSQLVEGIKQIHPGGRILLEHKAEDERPVTGLHRIAHQAGRSLRLDPSVIDSQTKTIAAVHHYFSELGWSVPYDERVGDMDQAYQFLVDSGKWDRHYKDGIRYARGDGLTDEEMDMLWEVYDTTFDDLVKNHPMAQKQPKNDFYEQTRMPDSKVVYALFAGRAVSALFLEEDASKLPWLNPDFFSRVNPDGKTIYVPAISTRLDMTGYEFSEKTIKAMAEVLQRSKNLTGFATQCTNRSATYIPHIAEQFTVGNVDLELTETAVYKYPVYIVE